LKTQLLGTHLHFRHTGKASRRLQTQSTRNPRTGPAGPNGPAFCANSVASRPITATHTFGRRSGKSRGMTWLAAVAIKGMSARYYRPVIPDATMDYPRTLN